MSRITAVALVAIVSNTFAFPTRLGPPNHLATNNIKREVNNGGAGTVPDTLATWDPEAQHIDTTGEHAWVAPTETDQRGVCPGLNAMANHGYLPHNGIATVAQYIEATNRVVGMAPDLSAFLSVYGAIFNGNGLEFSMGGPDSRVSLGLLGGKKQPTGLSGSHDNYENDASPTRGDLYLYGNDYVVRPEQFKQMYSFQADKSNEESNYNLEVLQQHRSNRFDDSLHSNPYFFNPPFSGLLVQPAAYTFIYRFMANHSEEYKDGQLTQEVLKSWFAMEGPDENGDFTNQHGFERIPDNWYRRSYSSEYGIPFFLLDVVQQASVYPKFLDIGGNVNGTDSFAGVDVGDLSGGVYNSQDLLEDNNLGCFLFGFLVEEAPDFLLGLYNDATNALSTFQGTVNNATLQLNCPPLQKGLANQFDRYPGYSKSVKDGQGDDGTAPTS